MEAAAWEECMAEEMGGDYIGKPRMGGRGHLPPKWDGRKTRAGAAVTVVYIPGKGGGYEGACTIGDRMAEAAATHEQVQLMRVDVIHNTDGIGTEQVKRHCEEEGLTEPGTRIILVPGSKYPDPGTKIWVPRILVPGFMSCSKVTRHDLSRGSVSISSVPCHVTILCVHTSVPCRNHPVDGLQVYGQISQYPLDLHAALKQIQQH